MFLFFSRSGYMKDKMNSLARSNASLYAKQHGNGGQEELYDRLRRHAYQGKKSGKKAFSAERAGKVTHAPFSISDKSGNETTSDSDGQ